LAGNKAYADEIERRKDHGYIGDSDYTKHYNYNMNDSSRHTDRKAQEAAQGERYTRALHNTAAYEHNRALDNANEAGEKTGTIMYRRKNGDFVKGRTIRADSPRALYIDQRERMGDTNWKGKITSR
jgi:hypothetical protein